jgi:hypothetical protein
MILPHHRREVLLLVRHERAIVAGHKRIENRGIK